MIHLALWIVSAVVVAFAAWLAILIIVLPFAVLSERIRIWRAGRRRRR